jgi:hypothetical protein
MTSEKLVSQCDRCGRSSRFSGSHVELRPFCTATATTSRVSVRPPKGVIQLLPPYRDFGVSVHMRHDTHLVEDLGGGWFTTMTNHHTHISEAVIRRHKHETHES